MSQITIKCSTCGKDNTYSRIKLSQYWDKKVMIKCAHCGFSHEIIVNQALMAGKLKERNVHPPDDPTIVLQPNNPQIKLASLHILDCEYNKHQIFQLTKGDFVIGRETKDDIHIINKFRIQTHDTKMSRSHCQISVTKRPDLTYRYILSDLGSLNGTFYFTEERSKRLEPNEKIIINPGDIIGLGNQSKIKLV